MGLGAIHSLTTKLSRKHVRVELITTKGERYIMEYKHVTVGGKEDGYRINIGSKTAGTQDDHFR